MPFPNVLCSCGVLVNEVMPNVGADETGDLWHEDDDGVHRVLVSHK